MFEKAATATRVRRKRGAKSPAKRRRPAGTYRERNAARMRAAGAVTRNIRIPTLSAEDRAERLRREADDVLWLRSYWSAFSPDVFYSPSAQQLQMIADFRAALEFGGDRADAASRGEGKTTFAVALTLKEILRGTVDFAILLGANAENAGNMLSTIRGSLVESAELARFYPEVCIPVAALENTAQRAGTQTVSGDRFDTGEPFEMAPTNFHWAGNKLIFPHVPGSPSAGAIVVSQGLDSALRGLKIANRRPRVVLIDDPDTDDTINNPIQAQKLLMKIDRGIAALGSQQRPVTRIALVTIASRTSVAAQLTNRDLYQSWRGRRFRFLITPPTATTRWQEFVRLCKEGWTQGADDVEQPPIPLAAHTFYLEHRSEMDAGAEVSNPNRYDTRLRPEGGTVEVSALEHYYGWVARIGQANTSTEFDNSPPDDEHVISGLAPYRVQTQVSGLPRGVVPPNTIRLTQGIDVGKRWLHWVVRAWVQGTGEGVATGYTIDYGETPTRGTVKGTEEGVDEAIKRALRERAAQVERDPYCMADGTLREIDLTLIDCQYRMDAIYEYCDEAGLFILRGRGVNGHYSPAAGVGKSNGAIQEDWAQAVHATDDSIPGDFWKQTKQSRGIWQTRMHADSWKMWEHDRWQSDPAQPGALLVWGERPTVDESAAGKLSYDQRQHRQPFPSGLPGFADQICAEVEAEEVKNGITVRRWVSGDGLNMQTNHLFDAAYRADVAASMLGVPLVGRRVVTAARPRRKVVLMGAAR